MAESDLDMSAEWWEGHGPEAMLARRLRQLRLARGMSQQDVADRMRDLGHPWYQTTVARMEKGGRPIRLNEAAALAFLFEISPQELLAVEPPEPEDRGNRAIDQLRGHVDHLALLVQAARRMRDQYETEVRDAISRAHAAQKDVDRLESDLAHVRSALDQATGAQRNPRKQVAPDSVSISKSNTGYTVSVLQVKGPKDAASEHASIEAFVDQTDFDKVMPMDWSAEGYEIPGRAGLVPGQSSEDSTSTVAE